MKISFHGGAKTVTGSKHVITLDNARLPNGQSTKILLDCGMFQGMGFKTDELNYDFGFNASEISFLLLSHAHIDHSGLIPKLVKDGFRGKIYSTAATRDLAEILLHDSAEIQTYDIEYTNKIRAKRNMSPLEPLYSHKEVEEAMTLFEVVNYNEELLINDDIKVVYTNAGHLIGSASIHLTLNENGKKTTIAFSGDVGRYSSVLLPSPEEIQQADYIILESTYGDKRHDISFNNIRTIREWVEKTCIEKGGKLIIPAFSVGRTQEVLYALNQLELENRLPEIKYFVDSPLSMKATEVLKKYKEDYNERLQQVLQIDEDPFAFEGLKYVENVEDSKKLVDFKEPCVIISASGTADAGRVRHHIFSCINDSKNSILFVGYCGDGSLGSDLIRGTKAVEIFGEECGVAAEIGRMDGMSAHGDCDDLCKFISGQDPEKVKKIFLVHGEYQTQMEFQARLERKDFKDIQIPSQHQEYLLD